MASLDDALELGSLVLPAAPGRARFLDIPGVVARSSSIPSPFVNLAGRLRLSAEHADAALHALREHFVAQGMPFGVMLAPASAPADLAKRLEALELRHAQRCEGLVLTDIEQRVPISEAVVVRRIGNEERATFDRMKAESFEFPLAVAQTIDDLLFGAAGGDAVFHLAYVDGEPVGFSQTFYYRNVAILGGAGVIPAARGRGAFRTLLARRLELARRDGLHMASIQAYDHTSAPILKRLGFTLRCDLHLWHWHPPAS